MVIAVIGAWASGMVAGNVHILPRILDAAARFTAPPAETEMQAMAARLGMQPLFT